MNNQQIFSHVRKFLLKQGEKSYLDNEGCVYRGPNERMCAVGCLIQNDEYRASFEGDSIESILNNGHKFKNFNRRNLNLLMALQELHDSFAPDEWKTRFKDVANDFDLKNK